MAKENHLENMEQLVGDALYDLYEVIQDTYPSNSIIQTTLMASYMALTPADQMKIVEQVGADWFIKLSARIEKRLRSLTKPE